MAALPANSSVQETPPSASELFSASTISDHKIYWDRSHYGSPEAQKVALEKSNTLYVGNLGFETTTAHLYAHFSRLGPYKNQVKKIIMGVDRNLQTPCGFAFVEYKSRKRAEEAILYLTGTKLDGRIMRVELDAGFQDGRQFGRGAKGGQVRDDRRPASFDPGRSRRRFTPASGGGSGGNGVRPYPGSGNQARPYPSANDPEKSANVGEKRGRDENNSGAATTNELQQSVDRPSSFDEAPSSKAPKLDS